MEHIKRTGRILGSGAKGIVHLGFDEEGGRFVAIKELHLAVGGGGDGGDGGDGEQQASGGATDEILRSIRTEVQLLQRAQHENVVKYYGSQVTADGKLTLVMEYVSGGSLASVIKRHSGLRDAVVRAYARDVLCGLQYLHDVCRTSHRDVKPENILVTPEGRCKLADFGASRSLEQSTLLKTCIGTPYYMAPEVVQGDGYDEKADIWSFGATLYEMVVGKPPFHDISNPMAVLFRIGSACALPPMPQQVNAVLNPDIKDLIAKCCAVPKDERPSASALLRHPFFGGGGVAVASTNVPPPLAAHTTTVTSPRRTVASPRHLVEAAAPGSVATAPPTQSMTASTTMNTMNAGAAVAVQSPTAAQPPAQPAAAEDDTTFPFFSAKPDHDVEAWRLCPYCRSAIALFSCDSCASIGGSGSSPATAAAVGGGVKSSRYCASCWATSHAHQRAAGHIKRPLLMQQAPPPQHELRCATSTGSLASLQSQTSGGAAAASTAAAPPPPPTLQPPQVMMAASSSSVGGATAAAGSALHHDATHRRTTGYGSGLLLPDGTFVDVLCTGEQSEWTCGRCSTLNDGPAYACFMCGHLR